MKNALAEVLDQGVVVHSKNARGREYWAKQINEAWQSTIDGIRETGNRLEAAKCELPYGEWGKMCKEDLLFNRITAFRLIAISGCEHLADVTHVQQLPAHWGTLYELTKVDENTFEAAVADGRIHPKMQRKDVIALLPPKPKRDPAAVKPAKLSAAAAPQPPAPDDDPIDPLIECIATVRSDVLLMARKIKPERWPELIKALRAEIKDIDAVLKERGKENAGHNT